VQAGRGADLALVEGNKGLYDGLALDGSNSNAALARRLGLPVLLVIDARGMTRGIAPLLLGYQAFDRAHPHRRRHPQPHRRRAPRRQAARRGRALHRHPGARRVADDPRLAVMERHLGLMPCAELDDAQERVQAIGRIIAAQVELPRVRGSRPRPGPSQPRRRCGAPAEPARAPDLRIAIARDRAFGFYYPDDLAALQAAGAELVFFDTLHDAHLPAADGLFIGGGFPEACMDALEANAALREDIRAAIEAGLPTYAECGGLMYLARSIRWQGRTARMVGAIPGDAVMHARPVGRGYVHLQETAAMPWGGGTGGGALRGHEFHHSSLENLDPGTVFAYRVQRGHGLDGAHDGVCVHNLLASYAHLRTNAGRRSGRRVSWPTCGSSASAGRPERGNNHHLHEIFPVGGPQKQGNRLAGLLRTKGEH
jgi:cobyrinic acid a,c-diamide synthase